LPYASVCATTVYYILHYNLADLSDDLPHVVSLLTCLMIRVDTKWRFQFFAKYDYRILMDVIIAIIATFFA
jgi:hypothetical protein